MFSIYNKTWDSTLKYSKHAVGKSQYMKQDIYKFLGAITEPYEKNTQGKLCTYDTWVTEVIIKRQQTQKGTAASPWGVEWMIHD